MRSFPAEPVRVWPISTSVNKLENDDASIADPIAVPLASWLCAELASRHDVGGDVIKR